MNNGTKPKIDSNIVNGNQLYFKHLRQALPEHDSTNLAIVANILATIENAKTNNTNSNEQAKIYAENLAKYVNNSDSDANNWFELSMAALGNSKIEGEQQVTYAGLEYIAKEVSEEVNQKLKMPSNFNLIGHIKKQLPQDKNIKPALITSLLLNIKPLANKISLNLMKQFTKTAKTKAISMNFKSVLGLLLDKIQILLNIFYDKITFSKVLTNSNTNEKQPSAKVKNNSSNKDKAYNQIGSISKADLMMSVSHIKVIKELALSDGSSQEEKSHLKDVTPKNNVSSMSK